MRKTFKKALAVFVFGVAAISAPPGSAHGALDYHVIEYHYMQMGPYTYVLPYRQRDYYCDGHVEVTDEPGGSLGLAYEQTFDDGPC